MKPEELHEGLQVIVAGERGDIGWDEDGIMKSFIDRIVTIRNIEYDEYFSRWEVRIEEDRRWIWSPDDLNPIIELDPISDEELAWLLLS